MIPIRTAAITATAGRAVGGRPKSVEPRAAIVSAAVSVREQDALRRRADASGLSLSAYARNVLILTLKDPTS